MLLYSKERFYPTLINTLVLQDAELAFWYVHRSVYDPAITLGVKQTVDSLVTLIDSEHNHKASELWYEKAPVPLNILAPFFGLVTKELPQDIEILAGVMHVITSQVDVYNLIRQKKEIRQTIKFSLSVTQEYQMSWDSFKAQASKPVFNLPLFNGQTTGSFIGMPAQTALITETYKQPTGIENVLNLGIEGVIEEGRGTISLEGIAAGTELELTVEDLKKDPNWTDLGFGTWYNATLDQSLCFDVEEEEYAQEFETMMQKTLQDLKENTVQEEQSINNDNSATSTLRSKLKLGMKGVS